MVHPNPMAEPAAKRVVPGASPAAIAEVEKVNREVRGFEKRFVVVCLLLSSALYITAMAALFAYAADPEELERIKRREHQETIAELMVEEPEVEEEEEEDEPDEDEPEPEPVVDNA